MTEIRIKDSIGHGVDDQIVAILNQPKKHNVVEVNGEPKRISYSLPVIVKVPKK